MNFKPNATPTKSTYKVRFAPTYIYYELALSLVDVELSTWWLFLFVIMNNKSNKTYNAHKKLNLSLTQSCKN